MSDYMTHAILSLPQQEKQKRGPEIGEKRNGAPPGADQYLWVDKRTSVWRLAFLPEAFCTSRRAIWVQLFRIIEASPSGIEKWISSGGYGVL